MERDLEAIALYFYLIFAHFTAFKLYFRSFLPHFCSVWLIFTFEAARVYADAEKRNADRDRVTKVAEHLQNVVVKIHQIQ